MKLLKKAPVIFLLLILALSCQSPQGEGIPSAVSDQKSITETPDAPEAVSERKLIKEGQVEFETPHLDSTRKTVFSALNTYKGYVASDQTYNSPGRISNTLTLRVPAIHFEDLLREATKGVKKVDNKSIQVKDVTEEYLDVTARIKTKKELELRYLELLKKANTVTEVLEIEKQSGELRAEIESIEGRLKYLENQVSFSTLTLTFYESSRLQKSFGKQFAQGFRNGWENLVAFLVLLVNIWPFVLILIIAIVWFRIRATRKKNSA